MKVKLLFLFLMVQMFLAPGSVNAQWFRSIPKALKAVPQCRLKPVIAGAALTKGYQAYQYAESERQRIAMRQFKLTNAAIQKMILPSNVSPADLYKNPAVRKTTSLKGSRTYPKVRKKK